MSKTQNNKLQMIMLPVSMLVAGTVSGLPPVIAAFFAPFLQNNLGLEPVVSTVVSRVGTLVGSILFIITIVLFSLTCKGLQKKLCFIMSVYVGSIANVLGYIVTLFTSVLLSILPIKEVAIQSLVLSGGNAIGGVLDIACEILVAVFFFKYLSSFTEKTHSDIIESGKSKLLVPCIIVAGYGVLCTASGFVTSPLIDILSARFVSEAYLQISLTQIANTISHIILWGALIGLSFLVKDKYQRITLVGSIIAGRGVCSFLSILLGLPTVFFPEIYSVINSLAGVVIAVLGVVAGIILYLLANKKQYVIKK